MSTVIRPQTAPKRRPMTAQQSRPLGRVSLPLRQEVAAHGSNPDSVIAAIKGDLLAVQRRVDLLRRNDRSSAEMEFLERHLLQLNATSGDELATSTTINTLLEMLLQRFNALGQAALTFCDEQPSDFTPGRTGGVFALVSFVESIAERKRLWDRVAPSTSDGWCQDDRPLSADGKPTSAAASPQRNLLDDALNEPTASQLRKLIADQRILQQQLQATVEQNASVAAKAREEALRQSHAVDQAKRAADAAVLDLTKQRDALRKRVLDLELEVKRLHDHQAEHDHAALDAHPSDVYVKTAGALAFAQVDAATLQTVGFDSAKLVLPPQFDSDGLATKISQLISEALTAIGDKPLTDAKGRRVKQAADTATQNTEGVLWWMLSAQSGLVDNFSKYLSNLQQTFKVTEAKQQAEIDRLTRVIAALDERVAMIKASSQRHAELIRSQPSASGIPDEPRPSTVTVKRVLNVRGQPVSPQHREQALQAQVDHQALCITELRNQIKQCSQALEDEQRRQAISSRENVQLLQATKLEASKTGTVQQTVALLENEIQLLRTAHQQTKKELRERTATEAELLQAKWKLEVELHIAQNVITELRQREEQLSKDAREAAECQKLMAASRDEERAQRAVEIAQLKEKLRESRAEEEVARQALKNERTKMIEHEKEVERLRALDLQMDVLEQNFTNYAACKLAQREAIEEEDRILQGCVDSIGRDVFVLPSGVDSEERVRLHLSQLRSIKEAFDAEERTRKRHKATSVNWKDDRSGRKQLAHTMQQRYNAIQIFACEERLRQMDAERKNNAAQYELAEFKSRQESLLVELSHAKSQCDNLVQRNTELELQRKEFTKYRVLAEQEIKSLKNTIHKMRVANEEQEKVLIDVGTRLQQSKNREGLPSNNVLEK